MFIVRTGNYEFEGFGLVRVYVKTTARYLRARWKGGMLVVSAPAGISYDSVHDFLKKFSGSIEQARPDQPYHIGQQFDFGELRVTLRSQRYRPGMVTCTMDGGDGHIDIAEDLRLDSPGTIRAVSKLLCRMAQSHAPSALLPRARQMAAELGVAPLMWRISNGHRLLGKCGSDGVIYLSYCLVFYPPHLRDYIICHELAHLSELNHSPRFHRLCDQYCGGRERELEAELKAFKLPVIR